MVEGFRRTDSLSVPQLAVPVSVPTTAYETHLKCGDPILKRKGCLMLVAFYYLLRVGKYTRTWFSMQNEKRVLATQTKKFVVRNVGFFKDDKVVKRTSPLAKLLTANLAVLKITNQKNGCMGQTITQHVTTTPHCLVKTLAHIVHEILFSGGTDVTLLRLVRMGTKWQDVTSQNMVVMI